MGITDDDDCYIQIPLPDKIHHLAYFMRFGEVHKRDKDFVVSYVYNTYVYNYQYLWTGPVFNDNHRSIPNGTGTAVVGGETFENINAWFGVLHFNDQDRYICDMTLNIKKRKLDTQKLT